MPNEYEDMTPLDWAEYEFATIEYDYQIHPEAARRIRELLERVYNEVADMVASYNGLKPCDCIREDANSPIVYQECNCGNYDDCAQAQEWCGLRNLELAMRSKNSHA